MTNSTDLQLNLTLPLSSLISNLTSFSIMIASANPVYLVDKRRTQYEQYLEHIVWTVYVHELRQSLLSVQVINTTDWITTVSSQFLDSLHQNLSQFVYTTCSQFNSSTITLGLPSSQRDVASHVGSRYRLGNMYCYVRSCFFLIPDTYQIGRSSVILWLLHSLFRWLCWWSV